MTNYQSQETAGVYCGAVIWKKISRMDLMKFFKGCLPQILLDPFLNTLPYMYLSSQRKCSSLTNNVDRNFVDNFHHPYEKSFEYV